MFLPFIVASLFAFTDVAGITACNEAGFDSLTKCTQHYQTQGPVRDDYRPRIRD